VKLPVIWTESVNCAVWNTGAEITVPSTTMPSWPVGQAAWRVKQIWASSLKGSRPSGPGRSSTSTYQSIWTRAVAVTMPLPVSAVGPSR
jgi:hypothetical protein